MPDRWRLPGRWCLGHASRFPDGLAVRPAPPPRATPKPIACPLPDLTPAAADGCELVTMATMVAVGPGRPAQRFPAVARRRPLGPPAGSLWGAGAGLTPRLRVRGRGRMAGQTGRHLGH